MLRFKKIWFNVKGAHLCTMKHSRATVTVSLSSLARKQGAIIQWGNASKLCALFALPRFIQCTTVH